MFCKFIQVSVRFVFPIHMFGELEFIWKACPVLQHSRFVSRYNDSKLGIQADLGKWCGVHFVKDMEGVVASPAIIDEDFPCGLF